jgi:hypothetical protein
MLANWRFYRRGEALQTLKTYLEKLYNYENISEEDRFIGTDEEEISDVKKTFLDIVASNKPTSTGCRYWRQRQRVCCFYQQAE